MEIFAEFDLKKDSVDSLASEIAKEFDLTSASSISVLRQSIGSVLTAELIRERKVQKAEQDERAMRMRR